MQQSGAEITPEPKASVSGSISVYSAIQQPAAMSEHGNMACNWREWKIGFDYYLIASGKDEAGSREKCALFLHVIGKFGREILEELDLDDKTKNDYKQLVLRFEQHCDPARNVNYERHLFFEISQQTDTFDKFLSNLKTKSKSCEFGGLRNSLILTQIIRGIRDPNMRERLLAKHKLELDEAVSWCRVAESAGQQAQACAGAGSSAAPALEELGRAQRGRAAARGRFSRPPRAAPPLRLRTTDERDHCGNCGRRHSIDEKCWAKSVKCYRCDRVGHFAKMCRSRIVGETLEDCEDDPEYPAHEFTVSGILLEALDCTTDDECEPWYQAVQVNDISVTFKLDSGADASVMSLKAFKEAGFQERILKNDKVVLREISRSKLPVVGYFEPLLSHKNNETKQKIYVLNVQCNNLLSLSACKQLNLIKRICEMSLQTIDDSVFEGLGCLPTICKILVNENVSPVINASRKVPIKLKPRLKEELDNMVKLNVIIKEENPTDWVSNIVVVERSNKKMRICLDPFHLNKAVRRCHFQLPTIDEIASNLTGANYFSKLDAKNGFWMLRLDEPSSKLTTFATPFGRYRFLRMPFGINSAPEIFHHEMYKIFSMPGVEVYCDDILVWGTTKAEHDSRLAEVIDRAKKNSVKFNKDKCILSVQELVFLGHVFNSTGIRPDTNRVEAIVKIPKPVDKKELERFLGISNYLSRFIPNYSNVAAPLRELLKKEIEYNWSHEHDRAFDEIKQLICKAPVLRFYNPNEPVTLTVDASGSGLGACLLQGGRPVSYAARTLAPTEQRWAQIEKELLAILFACERFHQYVYGHSQVTVESDHKPLEAIFKKPLNETPARLQRMLLRLQAYHLEIVYKPGKLMFIADALSRAAVTRGSDADVSDDVAVHVNAMYEHVEATPQKLTQIRQETEKDMVLSSVVNYYYAGWPGDKKDVGIEARPYWSMRNEFHVVNGILFRNDKIVIPKALRKEMLGRLHEGHLGIEKCKRRARDVIWWPSMGADIEQEVARCEPCARHRAAPPREPLQPHAQPELPWQVVAADIFELKGAHYLLVVDYYSKFVEVLSLVNLQSKTVIIKMKSVFARFGIPTRLVTDNGTQFTSSEFKKFASEWEFKHVTSSPLYPRSNGLAERNVQTVKRMFIKASEDGTEWQLALLNFRNTPITGEKYSPAQLLMGRSLNTRLPVSAKTLTPQAVLPGEVLGIRHRRVSKMKEYYDEGTKPLKPLETGEEVRVREGAVWHRAKVVSKAGDRSYWLKVHNGGTIRRNRSHIMKTMAPDKTYNITNRFEPLACDRGQSMSASPPPHASTEPAAAPAASRASAASSAAFVTRSGRIVRKPDRF